LATGYAPPVMAFTTITIGIEMVIIIIIIIIIDPLVTYKGQTPPLFALRLRNPSNDNIIILVLWVIMIRKY
jgi:hypothetical protein